MERLFSRCGLIRNEKGTVLVIMVAATLFLSILFAVMVEIGRLMIIKEEIQTATDAAALASAMSELESWVDITVITTDRSYWSTCCSGSGKKQDCRQCCKPLPDHYERVVGKEVDLICNKGWEQYIRKGGCGGRGYYIINDRWVKYKEKTGTGDTADDFFKANLPQSAKESFITEITAYGERGHPAYPSVIVYVKSKIESLFPTLLELNEYEMNTCSQGSTFYEIPGTGKMSKPPEDYCWVDW
jgi:hypothetical protein